MTQDEIAEWHKRAESFTICRICGAHLDERGAHVIYGSLGPRMAYDCSPADVSRNTNILLNRIIDLLEVK